MNGLGNQAVCCLLCLGLSAVSGAATFVGADGTGSGKLSEPTHWDPVGVPTGSAAAFTKDGTATTDSDVSVGQLSIDYANAAVEFLLGGHVLSVGGLVVGGSSGSDYVSMSIKGGTVASSENVWVSQKGVGSTVSISDGGRLSAPGKTIRLGGYGQSSGNFLYVGEDGSLDANSLMIGDSSGECRCEVDGATNFCVNNLYIGNSDTSQGNEMIIRDSSNLALGTVYVGNNGPGAHLLVTNVSNISCSSIYVGNNASATGARAELFLPSTCRPSIYVGRDAAATGARLLYDAGGASVSCSTLVTYFSANAADTQIEFRNFAVTNTGAMFFNKAVSGWGMTIGRGSTVATTFSSYAPLYLEGAEGTRLTIDGGTMDLTGSGFSTCFCFNNRSPGKGGNVFEVLNGGVFNGGTKDVYIGYNDVGGDLLTAGNVLRVANNATMTFGELRLYNSSQTIVVSNAAISATKWLLPSFSPAWATNNVVRFEGETPTVRISDMFLVNQSVDGETQRQRSETIFEFVVPAGGYSDVPIEAMGFNLYGNVRLRVDASAYAGAHRWMTVMKATSSKIVIDDSSSWNSWENFVSELPDGCEARLANGNTEVQIRIRSTHGFQMIVR